MYGRMPRTHTFDHTRRSQDDILVYSENQLRNVLGNIQRGKRVVIVGTIPISKPVEIKIAEDLTTTIVSQFVTITGFGSGRLVRKQGVDDPFNMFLIRTESLDDPSGLHFLDLSFDGFDAAIATKTNTVCNLRVIGCTAERCRTLIGDASPVNGFLLEATIQNNWCYGTIDGGYTALTLGVEYQASKIINNTATIPDSASLPLVNFTVMDDSYFDCIISGNSLGAGSLVNILMRKTLFTSNNSEGALELRGFGVAGTDSNVISANYSGSGTGMDVFNMNYSTITGNNLTRFAVDQGGLPTSEALNITGNTFLFEPIVNVECFIFRNNFGGISSWDVYGDGRIPIDGEILGQTIVDTRTIAPANPFIHVIDQLEDGTLNSAAALDNDNNAAELADVSFHVPCGQQVLIRLHCHLYDDDKAVDDMIFVRIVDVDTTTGVESFIPIANCNSIQQASLPQYSSTTTPNKGSSPHTFEWLIRGNIGLYWTVGEERKIRFMVTADNNNANVWVMAGSHWAAAPVPPHAPPVGEAYGPLISSAEAVCHQVNYVEPS